MEMATCSRLHAYHIATTYRIASRTTTTGRSLSQGRTWSVAKCTTLAWLPWAEAAGSTRDRQKYASVSGSMLEVHVNVGPRGAATRRSR